jgi:lipoate-protein ligase A
MTVKTYQRATWRLLISPPASGSHNMAVDEAILEATGKGVVAPTLRLYTWKPGCLSLGYAQASGDANRDALAQNDWDLVRRPTGGRAILHIDELTYSVCGPPDEPRLQGGVLESYQRLSIALLRALELLSIPAQASQGKANPDNKTPNPVCFEVPSSYEITFTGKKLIGSAQARRKEGVLQHGSFPLKGDLGRIIQALEFPDPEQRRIASERLYQRALTAEQALGYAPDWQDAAMAFSQAFMDVLNLNLIKASLSPGEKDRARQLMVEKYANPAWTDRI